MCVDYKGSFAHKSMNIDVNRLRLPETVVACILEQNCVALNQYQVFLEVILCMIIFFHLYFCNHTQAMLDTEWEVFSSTKSETNLSHFLAVLCVYIHNGQA